MEQLEDVEAPHAAAADDRTRCSFNEDANDTWHSPEYSRRKEPASPDDSFKRATKSPGNSFSRGRKGKEPKSPGNSFSRGRKNKEPNSPEPPPGQFRPRVTSTRWGAVRHVLSEKHSGRFFRPAEKNCFSRPAAARCGTVRHGAARSLRKT